MATSIAPQFARPDARILDPDAIEQLTAKGMMDPSAGGADKGLSGVLYNEAMINRGARSAEYMKGLAASNALQAQIAQQNLREQARQHNLTTAAGLAEKAGFSPTAFNDLLPLLNGGELAGVGQTQNARNDVLKSTALKNAGEASAAFGNSNVDLVPGEMSRVLGLNTQDNTPTRLRMAELAAQNKGPTISIQTPGPNGSVITEKGPATAMQSKADATTSALPVDSANTTSQRTTIQKYSGALAKYGITPGHFKVDASGNSVAATPNGEAIVIDKKGTMAVKKADGTLVPIGN